MIQKTLYTGGGVSLSPLPGEGRRESSYIRLVAEEGMAITDGSLVTICIDVRKDMVTSWRDCDLPALEEDATEADYQNALREMGVGV